MTSDARFIYNRRSEGIDYTTLNSFTGKQGNITIPEEVNGIKLIHIGDNAFYYTAISSVIIPCSVTGIGTKAFYNNLLSSILIPNLVTSLGDYAFQKCRLTSIDIPSNVMNMGIGVFKDNLLTSVTINSKESKEDFEVYLETTPFGWATNYSDDDISWQ